MATTVKRIVTIPGLGSYAFIFKPRQPKKPTDKAKYGITLLWPKSEKAKLVPLMEAIAEVAKTQFGENAVELMKRGKLKNPLRDGDEERPEDKQFRGMYFMNATGERAPGIVDRHNQRVFEDSEAYSGCTFRASVALFGFDRDGNKGVAAGLNNLQVVTKGPRLDGRKEAEEDFNDLGDGEESTSSEASPPEKKQAKKTEDVSDLF